MGQPMQQREQAPRTPDASRGPDARPRSRSVWSASSLLTLSKGLRLSDARVSSNGPAYATAGASSTHSRRFARSGCAAEVAKRLECVQLAQLACAVEGPAAFQRAGGF